MKYFLQNQGNRFNKSPKFLFFSYILGFLAPGIKTSLLKLFNFFSTCLGGKIAKYGGKKLSTCKGGKKNQNHLRSQSADLLCLRKRNNFNNFIGSRCWHCVSYWRWKVFSWTIAVTKGYWWRLEFLWLITFTTGRTAESGDCWRPRLQPACRSQYTAPSGCSFVLVFHPG